MEVEKITKTRIWVSDKEAQFLNDLLKVIKENEPNERVQAYSLLGTVEKIIKEQRDHVVKFSIIID